MMSRPELLAYVRELEWHMQTHPSESWEIQLRTAKAILNGGHA